MARRKHGLATCVAALLYGCGGGGGNDDDSSTPVAMATIQGTVFGSGNFGSGTIAAYSFTNGLKGTQLASSTLNAAGQYTLNVPASSTVVVEVTAGCYTEHASLKSSRLPLSASVCMASDEKLRAVGVPTAGNNHLNVTPYTEAATGLASYLATLGSSDMSAITAANQRFTAIVGIDITNTIPLLIDGTATLDDGHKYGVLLGGIASWIASLTNPGVGAVFGTYPYTSINAAQLMGKDIAYDGLLDGAANQSSLTIGSTSLSTLVYRHQFAAFSALHLRYSAEFTAISAFLPSLVNYNNSDDAVFSGATVPLDMGGPSIVNNTLLNFPSGSGNYTFSFTLDDVVGIPLNGLSILVDNIPYSYVGIDNVYLGFTSSFVNTTIFPNGNHQIKVRATNFLGSVTEQSAMVNFQN